MTWSTGRSVDGLWVGTAESEPEPILWRLEEALCLIKVHDGLRYQRLTGDLKRIWVLPQTPPIACFDERLRACKFNTQFILADTSTPELIAATIVHEATHARLWVCGIGYEEALRNRVEAVCIRRELAFASKLPNGQQVRERAERDLTSCGDQTYSNAAITQRYLEWNVDEALRRGVPNWILRTLLALRALSMNVTRAAATQTYLGLRYYNGHGVAQDYAEAMRWFRKAAEQGYATAQSYVGLMYAKGQGVTQDYAEAVRWFRKAADQGDAESQHDLGLMYAKGQGVPQDHAEAVRWFRKAADQGDAKSQHNLGVLYSKGEGVPQDYAEAVRWFRKAADQSYAIAQSNLGAAYAAGQGVPQDYVQAHMWFTLAAAQGDAEAAKYRDETAALMTPAQIEQAKALAVAWKPKTRR